MPTESVPETILAFAREEMSRLQVPGVSIGIVHEGRVHAGGLGVTSVEHPLEVDENTIFQIGSTSKTLTATVAMMLEAQGELDLEAPVRRYLPEFTTRSDAESARVTILNLLTHRTGWPGDYFKDFGRGDDALAVYVANMARAPQQFPAGAAFSYCNSGFYLLARVIESITGESFENTVRERLLSPLGMTMSGYHPEEVITRRTASGHALSAGNPVVARPWHMGRCLNGGGGLYSTAIDQMRYATFHLGDGTAPDGSRLLREETLRTMQRPHAEAGSMCDEYGLGWMLDEVNGNRLVKHGGATNGFLSSFELFPDRRFGCSVLTNAYSGRELRDSVAAFARAHFLGVEDRVWQTIPVDSKDLAGYAGHYRAVLAELDVSVSGDALMLGISQPPAPGREVQPGQEPPVRVEFYAPDKAVVLTGSHRGERCEFIREQGEPMALRWDGRLALRANPA